MFKYSLEQNEVPIIHFNEILQNCREYHLVDMCNNHRGLFFSKGKFDDYCAYLYAADDNGYAHIYAALDVYYFERLYWFATDHEFGLSLQIVYNHALALFHRVCMQPVKNIDDNTLAYIDYFTRLYYGKQRVFAKEIFMHIYYGMIAEENKANTKLGCLIKMHGIYNLLINQLSLEESANCMCGTNWMTIKSECDRMGLIR